MESEDSTLNAKQRYTGKVIKWIEDRGFGFAILDNQKVFLHVSKFNGHIFGNPVNVRVGSIIEAIIVKAVKGKQAFHIDVIKY